MVLTPKRAWQLIFLFLDAYLAAARPFLFEAKFKTYRVVDLKAL